MEHLLYVSIARFSLWSAAVTITNSWKKYLGGYLLFLLSDELRLDFRNSDWHLTLGVVLHPILGQVNVLEHRALLKHFHLPAVLKDDWFLYFIAKYNDYL